MKWFLFLTVPFLSIDLSPETNHFQGDAWNPWTVPTKYSVPLKSWTASAPSINGTEWIHIGHLGV